MSVDRLMDKLRRWKGDPVLFARQCLKIEPTDQQKHVMVACALPGAHVTVRSGHGVGKSVLMACMAIWQLLLHKDAKVICTAPSAPQLRDVLMSEINRILNRSHPYVRSMVTPSGMRVTVNGRESENFIVARTSRREDPTALQGFHSPNMMFLIDESFGVHEKIFEVARGALTTKGSRVLMAGNPTRSSGYVYETFNKNADSWKRFQLNSEDSSLVDRKFIEDMLKEYGREHDVYRVRVLGEFPSGSVNQLISRALIEKAMSTTLAKRDILYAPIILGVDPAWYGDDRSVVFKRQGMFAECLGVWNKVDSSFLGGMVNQFWKDFNADAVFVDQGQGTGVIDYLRAIKRNPIPVNFGGRPLSTEYVDKRTEMWCESLKWLESGGSLPFNEEMINDGVGPDIYFDRAGRKQLESKRIMKRRGLRSPDLWDAFALTFAGNVAQNYIEIGKDRLQLTTQGKVITDYDIFQ